MQILNFGVDIFEPRITKHTTNSSKMENQSLVDKIHEDDESSLILVQSTSYNCSSISSSPHD